MTSRVNNIQGGLFVNSKGTTEVGLNFTFAVGGGVAALPASLIFDLSSTASASYVEVSIDNAGVAVDKGGGEVGIPITGHDLKSGEVIDITLTTNYNGNFTIVSVTANEIVITDTFVSETFNSNDIVKSQIFRDKNGVTAYDFTKGETTANSTDDPTLDGTLGTTSARFDLDGLQYFKLLGANPTFFNELHRTSGTGSGEWWFAFAHKIGGTTTQDLFATTSAALQEGLEIVYVSTNQLFVQTWRGGTQDNNIFTVDARSGGDEICFILTGDPFNTDDIKLYYNSATAQTDTDAGVATSTVNAQSPMRLGTGRGGEGTGFHMDAGSEIYDFLGGNEYLTSSSVVDDIFTVLGARRGVDYLA